MDEFDDIAFDDYNFNTESTPATQTRELSSTPFGKTQTAEEVVPKKIKPIKFDEALLLESKGIHLLRNESRHLKFRGKNHEAEDLKRLMTYYTVWADNLFPKYKFSYFARAIAKPASGRDVRNLLSGWQDEFKEKMQVRRDLHSELSGQTVGDEEGYVQQDEESSDDDNRPLFFPMSAEVSERLQKEKKVPKSKPRVNKTKYRNNDTINSDEDGDDDDLVIKKKRRTMTFSDDEDDERVQSKPTNIKSGREYALSILAEKRKQRQLAQAKRRQEEEEEELTAAVGKIVPTKSVDGIMNEYYDDDDVQLALSDNELLELQLSVENDTTSDNNESTKVSAKDETDFEVIEMEI